MKSARQRFLRPQWLLLGSAIVLCACFAAWPARALAAQRAVGYGLRLEGYSQWPRGPGYQPLVITVTPLRPLTADRRLTFQVMQDCITWQAGYDQRVVAYLDLPAGSGPVRTSVSVPTTASEYSWKVEVSEDGVPLPRLTLNWSQASFDADEDALAECLPHVLWVGQDSADLRGLSRALDQVFTGSLGRMSIPTSVVGGMPAFAGVPAEDLPEQWIDYTSLDVVGVSLDELEKLRRQRPKAFEALRRWVFAGGNLWVFGIETDWRGLDRLDNLLRFPATPNPAAAGRRGDWTAPTRQSDSSTLFGDPSEGYYDADVAVAVGPEPLFAETETPETEAAGPQTPRGPGSGPSSSAPFRLRPLGLGLVVALAPDGPAGLDTRQCRWVFNEVGPERWQWPQRFGLSSVRPNDHFWEFLIPGVGLAPVTEFCILITLFVVGIGPVNYFVLRRWNRVHLLMFTVPSGAAAVTGLLLLYAVVADGLGVRTRVRSVTCLDQRTGSAACWARLSYYAGLAPSAGLVFPADVAVIPLEPMGSPFYDVRVVGFAHAHAVCDRALPEHTRRFGDYAHARQTGPMDADQPAGREGRTGVGLPRRRPPRLGRGGRAGRKRGAPVDRSLRGPGPLAPSLPGPAHGFAQGHDRRAIEHVGQGVALVRLGTGRSDRPGQSPRTDARRGDRGTRRKPDLPRPALLCGRGG